MIIDFTYNFYITTGILCIAIGHVTWVTVNMPIKRRDHVTRITSRLPTKRRGHLTRVDSSFVVAGTDHVIRSVPVQVICAVTFVYVHHWQHRLFQQACTAGIYKVPTVRLKFEITIRKKRIAQFMSFIVQHICFIESFCRVVTEKRRLRSSFSWMTAWRFL